MSTITKLGGVIGFVAFGTFIGAPYFFPGHPNFHEPPIIAFFFTVGPFAAAGYLAARRSP
jgi:hypothetical protein